MPDLVYGHSAVPIGVCLVPTWTRAERAYVQERIIYLRLAGLNAEDIYREVAHMIPMTEDGMDLVTRILEAMDEERINREPEPIRTSGALTEVTVTIGFSEPRKSVWEWIRSPAL